MKKRLVVGLSGASGAILCVSLLEAMRKEKDWEVHLVASEAGERVLREETGMNGNDLARLAFRTHDIGNIGAAIASGTFEAGSAARPSSTAQCLLTRKNASKGLLLWKSTPENSSSEPQGCVLGTSRPPPPEPFRDASLNYGRTNASDKRIMP